MNDVEVPEDFDVERAEKRRALFRCDDCGAIADAAVKATNPGTMMKLRKRWVEVHQVSEGEDEPTWLYFHFDEDDVSRGEDLERIVAAKMDETNPVPEPDDSEPTTLNEYERERDRPRGGER